MNDLISRQAAIDRINKQREHLQPDIYPQDKIGDAAYRICAEFIERLPSVQPVRKTGQWIKRKKGAIGYDCSCCGKSDISNHFDYCPNCGADMRGDKDD